MRIHINILKFNKKSILVCFLISLFNASYSQQTPLYSLYNLNSFAINPAISASKKYYTAQINNRYQFVGVQNAPITATISVFGPSAALPMAWGGLVFNDSQGALQKFGVYGNYAYNLEISKDLQVAMGLHVGIVQYTVDLTKVTFLEPEFSVNENMYTTIKPDATFGAFAYSKNYFAGVSFDQLFNNKIDVYEDTLVVNGSTINRLKSHVTIIGGYTLKINKRLSFEPTFSIRQAPKTLTQIELTPQLRYKKVLWMGMSFRSSDAVVALFGYNYRNMFEFGYAYDVTYSALRKDTQGAHEIMISFYFNSVK